MKTLVTALACSALGLGAVTAAAIAPIDEAHAAGPFDKLKKKVKKTKKKLNEAAVVANEVERAVETDGRSIVNGAAGSAGTPVTGTTAGSNYPRTAKAPGHAGYAAATPAKYANATKCANLGLGNAFVARAGDYTFQQGISTENRTGLLDRREVQPVNGCVFEGLGIGDVLYVEFDKAKFDKYSFRIQCVSYDGSEQQDNVFGPKIGNYGGKHVMLHTGNSTGYTPTASGSNADRNTAYKKYMDKRGRAFTTFNFEALHTDKAGTDFYCQWFNRDTGESALALTYRRGPVGS